MFSSFTSESLSKTKKDGSDVNNDNSGGESIKKRYTVAGANDDDISLLRNYSNRSIDRVMWLTRDLKKMKVKWYERLAGHMLGSAPSGQIEHCVVLLQLAPLSSDELLASSKDVDDENKTPLASSTTAPSDSLRSRLPPPTSWDNSTTNHLTNSDFAYNASIVGGRGRKGYDDCLLIQFYSNHGCWVQSGTFEYLWAAPPAHIFPYRYHSAMNIIDRNTRVDTIVKWISQPTILNRQYNQIWFNCQHFIFELYSLLTFPASSQSLTPSSASLSSSLPSYGVYWHWNGYHQFNAASLQIASLIYDSLPAAASRCCIYFNSGSKSNGNVMKSYYSNDSWRCLLEQRFDINLPKD